MKTLRKFTKYMLCLVLMAVMLIPMLSINVEAATLDYQLGFVDENGNRLYGTITVSDSYNRYRTLSTSSRNETASFSAESGTSYHVTFTNPDGYYSFYSFLASEKNLAEKPKDAVITYAIRVPYTVTVKYTDNTPAAGIRVTDNNSFAHSLDNMGKTQNTDTTTDSNGQCTVYGSTTYDTTVTVYDGVSEHKQTIRPITPGRKELTFTLSRRKTVTAEVLLNGQDVTNISQVTAKDGTETVQSKNGKLSLKEGVEYKVSAVHYEPYESYGFTWYNTNGFSATDQEYTANDSVITLYASLNKPVARYYDYSVQSEPFRFTDGGTQTLKLGQAELLDIENRIANAEYTFSSADSNVLSVKETVNGFVITAKNAGETNLTVTVKYLGLVETSVTKVKVAKKQIKAPSPDYTPYTYDGTKKTYKIDATADYTVIGNGQTNAGTYEVRVSLNDKNNTEWELQNHDTADLIYSLVIQKANLTAAHLTFTSPKNAVYDGSEKTASVKLKDGLTGAGELTLKYYDADGRQLSGAPINAGTYTVAVDAAEGTNFNAARDVTDSSWTFTVDRIDGIASISVPNQVVYGDGFDIAADSPTNGTGGVKYYYKPSGADDNSYSNSKPADVGEYIVKAVFPAYQNYKEIESLAYFEIIRRPVTVKADDCGKVYGENDPDTFGWTVTEGTLVDADTLDLYISREDGEDVGAYGITVSFVEERNPNYDITVMNGTFTIEKAKLTVTAEDQSAVYGDAVPEYTAKFDGFKLDDTEALFGEAPAFDCAYTKGSDVGEYSIIPKGCDDPNYTVEYIPGKLTVTEKPITEADFALNGTLTYNGLEQTQEIAAVEGITYETAGNKAKDAGAYTLTVQGTGNYTGEVSLGWKIEKAPLTVKVNSRVIYIGEPVPVFTAEVTGLQGADVLLTEPQFTVSATGDTTGTFPVTVSAADAGENYAVTFADGTLTVLDKDSEVETKVEKTDLTEVPEGLLNTEFNTVEAIEEELLHRIVLKNERFKDALTVTYDVTLQFSVDGGVTWITATAENFPTEGITLVLPYPDGTHPLLYDYLVSHMFTVTSERLGIKAGEVELPEVEETEEGLRVTLKGLSPVTVAAKYHESVGGTATCKDKAICTVCGFPYGELDPENHVGGTEVKNAKAETCAEDGYTGDTRCKGCGEVLEKGEVIAATGKHTYGEWETVKEATVEEKGLLQRVCSVCEGTETKETEKLEAAKKPESTAKPNNPATGDSMNLAAFGSLFAAGLMSLTGLIPMMKKRRK